MYVCMYYVYFTYLLCGTIVAAGVQNCVRQMFNGMNVIWNEMVEKFLHTLHVIIVKY